MSRHYRDSTAPRTTSEAVLSAVAEREAVREWELEPPLYEAIDPEALDAITQRSGGTVVFEYCGYTVTADGNSRVELSPIRENGTDNPS